MNKYKKVVYKCIVFFSVCYVGFLIYGFYSHFKSDVEYKLPTVIGIEDYNGYNTYDVLDEQTLETLDISEIDLVEDKSITLDFFETDKDIENGTPWKYNDSCNLAIAIEGRGKYASNLGEALIYLKKDNGITAIKVNDANLDIAPVYVEWYDDDKFLMYVCNKNETVFTEGTLYIIDVLEKNNKIVYKANKNEEILEATRISADIINIKILEHKESATVSTEKNVRIK